MESFCQLLNCLPNPTTSSVWGELRCTMMLLFDGAVAVL